MSLLWRWLVVKSFNISSLIQWLIDWLWKWFDGLNSAYSSISSNVFFQRLVRIFKFYHLIVFMTCYIYIQVMIIYCREHTCTMIELLTLFKRTVMSFNEFDLIFNNLRIPCLLCWPIVFEEMKEEFYLFSITFPWAACVPTSPISLLSWFPCITEVHKEGVIRKKKKQWLSDWVPKPEVLIPNLKWQSGEKKTDLHQFLPISSVICSRNPFSFAEGRRWEKEG